MATGLTIFALMSMSCAAIHSNELASMLAEDLVLEASIYEYSSDDEAQVSAQMETESSGIGIEFNQGESLRAYADANADTEAGISNDVYLSNNAILNLDQDYSGEIDKTTDGGNYYITYTDPDGNETTAIIPSFSVPEITNIENGDILSGTEAVIEWEPTDVSGLLSIVVSYSGSGMVGYRRKYVSNTGSYTMDIEGCVGSGTVDLRSTMNLNYMEGFGGANIEMNNNSRRYVSYSNTLASALVKGLSSTEAPPVEQLIAQCQTKCGERDEAYILVDETKYDCCVR